MRKNGRIRSLLSTIKKEESAPVIFKNEMLIAGSAKVTEKIRNKKAKTGSVRKGYKAAGNNKASNPIK